MIRMVKVFASVNRYDRWDYIKAVSEYLLAAEIDGLHFDLIDGHTMRHNPTLEVLEPGNIADLVHLGRLASGDADFPIDAHLFVRDVQSIAATYIRAGVSRLTIPFNAFGNNKRNLMDYLSKVKRMRDLSGRGLKTGVSFFLNEREEIYSLSALHDCIDYLHMMGSCPGYDKTPLMPGTVTAVSEMNRLKERKRDLEIVVEGGITLEKAKMLKKAGADILILGKAFLKYVDKAGDYAGFIRDVREA